jgi:hypothetical protein
MKSAAVLVAESVSTGKDVGDKGENRSIVSVRVETVVNASVLRDPETEVDTSTFHTMPVEPASGMSTDLMLKVSHCRFLTSVANRLRLGCESYG